MRIRTLKPEILTDEKAAALSDTEWRLFVSCIVMADDYGNFRASPSFIHSQAFWSCSTSREDSRKALDTLARLSLLVLYEVHGQQYAHVNGWSKHQKVDHPGKPVCPGIEQAKSTSYDESSRDSRVNLAKIPETLAPDQDQDQDQEGKGPSQVARARIRPRLPHDLIHCLRIAVQREQPENGPWNPGGSFSTKEASEFMAGFEDVEVALESIEKRIDIFAKDKSMSPWTVEKFAAEYNRIGIARFDQRAKPLPVLG